ncbi:hypothetical protein DFJ74DRAFT_672424 [Hyaloraphidium curvatum]|nr:hypothetical protein DFJ74DRAFT_672424 [Hyaloraphidium curvatum]
MQWGASMEREVGGIRRQSPARRRGQGAKSAAQAPRNNPGASASASRRIGSSAAKTRWMPARAGPGRGDVHRPCQRQRTGIRCAQKSGRRPPCLDPALPHAPTSSAMAHGHADRMPRTPSKRSRTASWRRHPPPARYPRPRCPPPTPRRR